MEGWYGTSAPGASGRQMSRLLTRMPRGQSLLRTTAGCWFCASRCGTCMQARRQSLSGKRQRCGAAAREGQAEGRAR